MWSTLWKQYSKDIIIDQSDIEELDNTWVIQWKQKPTIEESSYLLQSNIKQEVFHLSSFLRSRTFISLLNKVPPNVFK
ncbi:MAG: hypothetical protein ACI8ZM_005656 [Crocinitomix sp.]|jgi:hypothetical protein